MKIIYFFEKNESLTIFFFNCKIKNVAINEIFL